MGGMRNGTPRYNAACLPTMTRQRRNAERHGELLPAPRHDGTGREDGTKESGKREAGRDERRDDKKNGPPLLKERRSEKRDEIYD